MALLRVKRMPVRLAGLRLVDAMARRAAERVKDVRRRVEDMVGWCCCGWVAVCVGSIEAR